MKKLLCLFGMLFCMEEVTIAQVVYDVPVKIGDEEALEPSAQLEIKSNEKGLLIPRMTEAQKEGIINPALGLLVYQIDGARGLWFFEGTQWYRFSFQTGHDPRGIY